MFDFSGYEKDSRFYDDENKKLIGKMKDELKKEIIEQFVGLKEKIYSLKTKKEEMKKAKEAKKSVVKKYISRQDNVHCLFEERFMHTMHTYQLCTIRQNKVSFSSCDDKRDLLDDVVCSLLIDQFSLV